MNAKYIEGKCVKCHKIKLIYKSYCRECRRKYNKEYSKTHKEQHRKWNREYYKKNRGKILVYQKEHYSPEKARLYWQKYKLDEKKYLERKKRNRQYMKKYRLDHSEKVALSIEKALKRLGKIKLEVFIHYSCNPPKCKICGNNDMRVLTIDHIEGGGSKHRKRINRWGINFYKYLRDKKFPEGYQVLCRNCNWIKKLEGL